MGRFTETSTPLNGVSSITKIRFGDDRGHLERLFCCHELKCWGDRPVVQVNRTLTVTRGTVRGLHFQYPPYTEAKFISCLRGSVMDVILDMRKSSETFGKIFTIELNADEQNAVFISEGFAHGFQTLTDNVEMLYFHSAAYKPEFEAGINVFDSGLKIRWPLDCAQISDRDRKLPNFREVGGLTF